MNFTFIILKPDCVFRGLVGKVMEMIESEGLRIVACKMYQFDNSDVEFMYGKLKEKPYFSWIKKYMLSGPCIPIILIGKNAHKKMRKLRGATYPKDWVKGTIRHKFASNDTFNVIHTTDDDKSFKRETKNFFDKNEIFKLNSNFDYINKK